MKRICYFIPFLMILVLTGCGGIFTHVTIPLDINCSETPRGLTNSVEGNIKHIHLEYSNIDVDFMWDSNAIGDIAKRNKLEKIYFADMETLSILGIWNQYTVHIYGE